METTSIASVLEAAIERLSDCLTEKNASQYTCDLICTVITERASAGIYSPCRATVFKFLVELGLDRQASDLFMEFEAEPAYGYGEATEKSQFARALWLTMAQLIAEEEEV